MDNPAVDAILVLGMHRSGTSAVAGALKLLGATPPAHVLPAASDNPSGFWEAMSILGANDWILSKGGATWYDCLRFDADTLDAQTRTTALTFIMLCMMTEFRDAPLPLIKDPRLCLLMDLWLPALRARAVSPVALLVLRSPEAVAESLAARDDLPIAISAALWLRHMLDAEYATRGCRRHILAYDDLLRDWRSALTLTGQRAGIAWPVDLQAVAPDMDRFLDARLRHSEAVGQPSTPGSIPFAVWLEEAYAALRDLARDATDQRTLQRLDHVRAAFGTWCRTHGHAWADAFLHRHELRMSRRFEVPPSWHQIAGAIPKAMTPPVA